MALSGRLGEYGQMWLENFHNVAVAQMP